MRHESTDGVTNKKMLGIAAAQVREAGFEIANLDCIIFAQAPKLSIYKRPMAIRMAQVLMISPDQIGVKAKTGEGVGPIGNAEAISSRVVVLLHGS